jgi:hypothetical protein
MLAHLHNNIVRYGCANPGYLGELSERYHKVVAKKLWYAISKREATIDSEMLNIHIQLMIIHDRQKYRQKVSKSTSAPNDYKVHYTFNSNMSSMEISTSNSTGKWQAVKRDCDANNFIIPLINLVDVYDIVEAKTNCKSPHFLDNLDSDCVNIIRNGLTSTGNVRVFLMEQVSCSGMKSRKIEPFQIHSTRKFNTRNVKKKRDSQELDPQFSFIEFLSNDGNQLESHLGRTAFLLSFEEYDEENNRLQVVMLGGFVMLTDFVVKNHSNNPLPYRHMHYYIPRKEIKKNYPDIEIFLLENISAPTFVVCDYDSFNDPKDPDRVVHEGLTTRDQRHKWTKHVYFWLPFEWTCRDDSVNMSEFDNPPVTSEEAHENYFKVYDEDSNFDEDNLDEQSTSTSTASEKNDYNDVDDDGNNDI